MMGHKASLSKFKKIEILSSIFSDHNAIRLEIEYKKNVKKRITWRLNNMSLNNRSLKKSNREQKITYKEMKTKAWLSKTSRKKQKPFKEESYSNTILPQETRNISSNLTSHLKQLEEEQTKPNIVEGKKS